MARNCTKFAVLINANKKVLLLSLSFHQKREETLTSATNKQAYDFSREIFSGVSPLEKVKIIKSCGILILEKTENSLERVLEKNKVSVNTLFLKHEMPGQQEANNFLEVNAKGISQYRNLTFYYL